MMNAPETALSQVRTEWVSLYTIISYGHYRATSYPNRAFCKSVLYSSVSQNTSQRCQDGVSHKSSDVASKGYIRGACAGGNPSHDERRDRRAKISPLCCNLSGLPSVSSIIRRFMFSVSNSSKVQVSFSTISTYF